MNGADVLSIVINLAVGAYFAVLYPRSVKKRFGDRELPRGFALLLRFVPPAGWLIMAITVIYAITLLVSG